MIPFNKPYFTGKETIFIEQAVKSGKISGNGIFTKKCHEYFEKKYGIMKAFLTTSCTDALEMAAILINISPGDEVIVPSFTFVSTANAFVLRGAKIVFADSNSFNPNIDCNKIEELITEKTKAIIPVHYAGIACDMDVIMTIAAKYNLWVIEDAAQSIESFYKGRRLGTIGHLAAFSFHETKNITSGEGGMLAINDAQFIDRAEVVWEKGTDRAKFSRGEVDRYTWVDIGSSYLPSDITAAILYAQIEGLDKIQKRRLAIWEKYYEQLLPLTDINEIVFPEINDFAKANGQMFSIVCKAEIERKELIDFLKDQGVLSVFHYGSLHASPYFRKQGSAKHFPNSERYSNCLLRLPMFYELLDEEIDYVVKSVFKFFTARQLKPPFCANK